VPRDDIHTGNGDVAVLKQKPDEGEQVNKGDDDADSLQRIITTTTTATIIIIIIIIITTHLSGDVPNVPIGINPRRHHHAGVQNPVVQVHVHLQADAKALFVSGQFVTKKERKEAVGIRRHPMICCSHQLYSFPSAKHW
jgi:hypothetical protein